MIHCPAVKPLFCSLLCASGQRPECCVQVCRLCAAFEGRMVGCGHCSQCAKLYKVYSVQYLQSVHSVCNVCKVLGAMASEQSAGRRNAGRSHLPSLLSAPHTEGHSSLLLCNALLKIALRGLHTVLHTVGRKGEHRMQCRSCCSDTAVGKIQNCGRTKQSARAQWEWEQWEQWED